MKRKRRVGTTAALGALAVAFAFGGLNSARADELSDLQANVQLLQREVAQLQQRRSDPAVQAGSFKRSFLIPGSNTSISISGYVVLDVAEWLNGGPAAGTGNASQEVPVIGENGQLLSAPLDIHGQSLGGLTFSTFCPAGVAHCDPYGFSHSQGNGQLQFSARQSRLNITTRTPTAWGPASTVMEFDWLGGEANLGVSSSLKPRLRLAYGTLGPWLGGQAFGTTYDLQAGIGTIDFGGTLGGMGIVRTPQLRYTYKGPYGISAALGLEAPETKAFSPAGVLSSDATSGANAAFTDAFGNVYKATTNPTKATIPVVAAYLQWNQPWGHLRVQGAMQNEDFEDGHFIQKNFTTGGGGFAGNVRPGWFGWAKDNIQFQFSGGTLGRYLNGGDHAALATNFTDALAINDPAAVKVDTVTSWGGYVGYEHWWTPTIRSDAIFGMDHQDVPIALVGPVQAMLDINKEILNTHLNLLWSPVAFVNTGVEWIWGQRTTTGGAKGDMNTIMYMFMVKF
jgi:Porin subfamily